MLHHSIGGEGLPLLILHGASLDHRYMMETQEPVFQDAAPWQRVYVYLPGHGPNAGLADVRFAGRPFGIIGYSRGNYLAEGVLDKRSSQVLGAALIAPGGRPGSAPSRFPNHMVLRPNDALRAGLADGELWAFDNISAIQDQDIIDRRRRTMAPAQARHDPAQEARVKANFVSVLQTKRTAQCSKAQVS